MSTLELGMGRMLLVSVLRRTQVAGEQIGTRKGGKGTHMDQSDDKPLVEGCPAATACV